jgi:hypothetical protein
VSGPFLAYWDAHGGLMQQGYPISDELRQISPTDGREYTVQYFEGAVFEYHPQTPAPYDVLLSLLGVFEYRSHYGDSAAPDQQSSTDHPRYFPQTHHTLGGVFRTYWEAHGGLMQQGYPLSDEVTAISPLDGKPYTTQYFERAVFEYHPEHAGTPYEVLLSQLGTFDYRDKYQPPREALRARPGYRQSSPVASPDYLVWSESRDPHLADTADLFARDLHSGQVITVTDAPGDQYDAAVSGALVVWDSGRCCGVRDVLGKDLATGRNFAVATGPADQVLPAIYGRSVAWLEVDASGARVMLRDLDGGAPTTVTTLPSGFTFFGRPALNDDYLVWSEEPPYSKTEIPITPIRALDRRTGQIHVVASAHPANYGRPYPDYALAGHRLVWATGPLELTNLDTGTTEQIWDGISFNPVIAGDAVVWSAPLGDGFGIWGLRLGEGVARILVGGRGSMSGPVISGDLLAWANVGGPFNGRITVASLAAAFAGSRLPPPRPTANPALQSPTPLPPVPRFTETPGLP